MFLGPRFREEMLPFLAAGPSQGSPPSPMSKLSPTAHTTDGHLERMGVCCVREGRAPAALEAESLPLALGSGQG